MQKVPQNSWFQDPLRENTLQQLVRFPALVKTDIANIFLQLFNVYPVLKQDPYLSESSEKRQ